MLDGSTVAMESRYQPDETDSREPCKDSIVTDVFCLAPPTRPRRRNIGKILFLHDFDLDLDRRDAQWYTERRSVSGRKTSGGLKPARKMRMKVACRLIVPTKQLLT